MRSTGRTTCETYCTAPCHKLLGNVQRECGACNSLVVACHPGVPSWGMGALCLRRDDICDMSNCWAIEDEESDDSDAHSLFKFLSPWKPSWEANVSGRIGDILERVRHPISCLIDSCREPLATCSASAACRHDWRQHVLPHTKWLFPLATFDPTWLSRPVRELYTCFVQRCHCIRGAADPLSPVVRFASVATKRDIKAIFQLASSMNASFRGRRAFGSHYLDNAGVRAGANKESEDNTNVIDAQAPTKVQTSSGASGGHQVTYLQSQFEVSLPHLYSQLHSLAMRADRVSDWRLVRNKALRPRTIELLEYSYTSESLGWHVDSQSLITGLLLLSDPHRDFSGAELQHVSSGKVTSVRPQRGDFLVYRSQQLHQVTPLQSGKRATLAIEWWHLATSYGNWLPFERVDHGNLVFNALVKKSSPYSFDYLDPSSSLICPL
eukprot:CAMPEP_0119326248 /NCGR_PEP_ID=MMETSP1333-20130426/67914_1 /TAXON_ID=418940 /ORGANISM="Scyphosphaera apsteinii, Strain RCC1455" /LENGTH=436 /DNA_ID=CAMNT_0007334511 /DNA_START=226 /DNA_END=1536 /DNA_ORIENTATION=-